MSFHDPNPVNTPSTDSDHMIFTINSKIMLTAKIIILFILILIVSLHLSVVPSLLSPLQSQSLSHRHNSYFFANPSSTDFGLNPSVIKSLPNFTFSAATAQTVIECVVCLSEFEDNKSGRVLPNCKHTFHVDCGFILVLLVLFVDRSSNLLAGKVNSAADVVVISIFDVVSGEEQSLGPKTNQGNGNSVNPATEDFWRKKPAAIKVPRKNLGELENS